MRNDKEEFELEGQSGWGTQDLRHLTPELFANVGMPNIVYVREVLAGELASDLGSEIDVPADTKLYAVHAANGDRMAVLDNRDAAFAGARQYDLEPLSVH
ncbi:DUF1150 family protein [Parvibaculum sedimenti]|uniref:DUF1150 family protein n=1 Tax=Parvibaculum sedimenti TaxID=2608632 RepID=A0A6N6VRX9_9HYPH|nr:DUF1150 domain-containing protein [Parvibaculum sedimenti]KAB7742744.1 DUF1150 family protein [Parvibaculum sedimenti]